MPSFAVRETRQSIRRRERKGGAGSFNRLGPRLRIPHAEAFIRLPLAAHEANERSSPSEWKSLSRSEPKFEEYRGGPECRPLLGPMERRGAIWYPCDCCHCRARSSGFWRVCSLVSGRIPPPQRPFKDAAG